MSSKSLTKTESRYAQIEHEALAEVRSNVRRITVSTNFDGVTEIQVKQKLLDCWWLQSNIREAHKIKRLFSKFKRFVESIKVFFGRLVRKLQDLVTS